MGLICGDSASTLVYFFTWGYTFQFHEMLAAKVWTSHGGVLGKASNQKTWRDFPAMAVWLPPYEMTRFSTIFHPYGSVKHDSPVLVDWSMGDFYVQFSPNTSPWKTPKTIYTRSCLIHLKNWYIMIYPNISQYFPCLMTPIFINIREKKNSKPLWCHHQPWKIQPSSIGESSEMMRFSMSAMTSRYMALGMVSCTLWLWPTVC